MPKRHLLVLTHEGCYRSNPEALVLVNEAHGRNPVTETVGRLSIFGLSAKALTATYYTNLVLQNQSLDELCNCRIRAIRSRNVDALSLVSSTDGTLSTVPFSFSVPATPFI